MSIKGILPFGDPILRKIAKPVVDLHGKTIRLLDDMIDTLYETDGRAGLAAPQVGILRQLIVMDCGEGLIELINPEILDMSGEQVGTEACLSYPGYWGYVKRANKVKIKSLTREGDEVILIGEDYLARCMQHEIDHLKGILFVDHVQEGWLYNEHTKQRIDLHKVIRLTNQGM
ncbi:peptide deformylase [Paenibacillus endoradicis]|uniref:peptide deformylase n=1 Tax=Paenibacillus endoradicis TaxID=2972487 RepID=UPI00215908BC|nr:peptide deformylase [Paenibacillus endoradicis]MCR8655827.1 peptide deformylase [Paenibacillus endoradicis]MCR8658153.1 peptide deformylase [Paenibacillus endoradicis]